MAFLYWLIDSRQINRYAWVFTVVGMNAIFIYLFFETVGHQWLNGVVAIFIQQPLLSSLVTLLILWYLCYFLAKKKIFFKL
jgi:predicted acyltransferase